MRQRRDRFTAINRTLRTQRLIPWVLLLSSCLWASQALAELPVLTERVVLADQYEVERRWAGTVASSRSADLAFEHAGQVEQVAVDAGDAVTAGTVLATLDARRQQAALAQAEADVLHARALLAQAEADLQLARQTAMRHEQLVAGGHVPRQQWDETRLQLRAREAGFRVAQAGVKRAQARLRQAEVDLADINIVAPFDGIVQARLMDEGDMAQPAAPVLRLVETGSPEAHVGIPFDVATQLAPGDVVSFRYYGQELPARVRRVLPEVDPQTRTRTAIFDLDSRAAAGGDVIELTFTQSVAERGFWISLDALTEGQRGLWSVYAVNAASRVERRMVELLHVEGERAFVRGTVDAGEQVVVTGTQRLVPDQVVAATTSLAEAPGS